MIRGGLATFVTLATTRALPTAHHQPTRSVYTISLAINPVCYDGTWLLLRHLVDSRASRLKWGGNWEEELTRGCRL